MTATRVIAQPRELPEHVREGDEWKKWPRKVEAHVWYGARERQITAMCRGGKLVVWRCPDETLRIDPSQLEEHFGKPGVFQGRDRAPADPVEREARSSRKAAHESFDMHDPLPGLVRELTLLLRETRQEKLDVLRLVVDPMNHAVKLLKELTDKATARVEKLEARELETMALHEELASAKEDRELRRGEAAARQRNRDDLMRLLKDHWPRMMDQAVGKLSLAGFVRTVDPHLLQGLLEMDGLLNAEQKALLRKAAGLVDKTSNGKGDAPPGAAADTGTGPVTQAGVS